MPPIELLQRATALPAHGGLLRPMTLLERASSLRCLLSRRTRTRGAWPRPTPSTSSWSSVGDAWVLRALGLLCALSTMAAYRHVEDIPDGCLDTFGNQFMYFECLGVWVLLVRSSFGVFAVRSLRVCVFRFSVFACLLGFGRGARDMGAQ